MVGLKFSNSMELGFTKGVKMCYSLTDTSDSFDNLDIVCCKQM